MDGDFGIVAKIDIRHGVCNSRVVNAEQVWVLSAIVIELHSDVPPALVYAHCGDLYSCGGSHLNNTNRTCDDEYTKNTPFGHDVSLYCWTGKILRSMTPFPGDLLQLKSIYVAQEVLFHHSGFKSLGLTWQPTGACYRLHSLKLRRRTKLLLFKGRTHVPSVCLAPEFTLPWWSGVGLLAAFDMASP